MILALLAGYFLGVVVMAYLEWVTVQNTGKSMFQQKPDQH